MLTKRVWLQVLQSNLTGFFLIEKNYVCISRRACKRIIKNSNQFSKIYLVWNIIWSALLSYLVSNQHIISLSLSLSLSLSAPVRLSRCAPSASLPISLENWTELNCAADILQRGRFGNCSTYKYLRFSALSNISVRCVPSARPIDAASARFYVYLRPELSRHYWNILRTDNKHPNPR
jgi:hypothetical protein